MHKQHNQKDLTSALSRMDLDSSSKALMSTIPGPTSKTQEVTLDLLEKNNRNFDIFVKMGATHNHGAHHLLAAYAFGASSERLQEFYDINAKDQKPRLPSKVNITEDNWTEYVGQNELWTDFLAFFEGLIDRDGIQKIFETYVFHPKLFSFVFCGELHPLIHIGHGIEFQLPLMLAEGLAQAAVHTPQLVDLLDEKFLSYDGPERKTIFEIVEDISKDERLKGFLSYDDELKTKKIREEKLDVIKDNAIKWVIDETEEAVKKSTKELYDGCVLIYAATAIRPDKEHLRPEFFLMHGVTSSLFVYIMLAHLDLKKRIDMMRAHFASLLVYYVSRGCPKMHIDTLLKFKPKKLLEEPNPWLGIIKKALEEKDDCHVLKTIRSLYKAEQEFGPREDNLYLKAAQVTIEGYDEGRWSFNGLGWSEEWTDEAIKRNFE